MIINSGVRPLHRDMRLVPNKNDDIEYILKLTFFLSFTHNLPLVPVMSISSFSPLAQRFAKKCCFMCRTLNETVVDEVNGGQAAVSRKQIRNYGKSTALFLLPLK